MINNKYIILLLSIISYALFGIYKIFEIGIFNESAWNIFKYTIFTLPIVILLYVIIMFYEDRIQKIFGFKDGRLHTKGGHSLGGFWSHVFIVFLILLFFESTYINIVANMCDNPKEEVIIGIIVKKEISKSNGGFYLFYKQVKGEAIDLNVKKTIYYKFDIGDIIKFNVYKNCKGFKYYYYSSIKYEKIKGDEKSLEAYKLIIGALYLL
jgi:hypothetical protein